MKEIDLEEILRPIGDAILAREPDHLRAHVAPWISADTLFAEVESMIAEMVEDWALDADAWPSTAVLDSNPCSFEDLIDLFEREPDPAVTSDNFLLWCSIRLQADVDLELDAFADLTVVLVDDGGKPKLGYFEVRYPD